MSKNKGRVYASADWHGCGKLANQVLEYLNPEDTLYFIGDAIDRGPDGLEILDKLMVRPNTIFLKGNHEEMMADAIPYIAKEIADISYYGGNGYDLWYQNGGIETAKPLWEMDQARIFKYRKFIKEMPTEIKYLSPAGHTVILEHAGYTPFNLPHRSHDSLWDREHFYDKWDNGYIREGMTSENTYLVHGHTPVQYLRLMYGYDGMKPLTREEIKHKFDWYNKKEYFIPEIIRYADGHKFDIDMCTIVSKRIALLDLDTFEIKYFDEEE